MNTRRYPRTMNEAFGPYCGNVVYPMREKKSRFLQDWVLYFIAFVAALAIMFF